LGLTMNFEFATATRIIFGAETWREAIPAVLAHGDRVCLMIGRSRRRANNLIAALQKENVPLTILHIDGEPTTTVIEQAVIRARKEKCRSVVGFGGGSVIDTGKAIAALLTNEGSLLDYLEVIGKGRKIEKKPVPYVAIPTTAGTGAEVTRNAVIGSPQHKVKVSMRSPLMLPHTAIIDPTLTYELSPEITAATGLDALTQLIEAFVSRKANPLTDSLCREGIARAARALPVVYRNGEDTRAREDMALASLLSGLALANAGLGAVHGFAGPIGGLFPAPHGAVCACLLPNVMAANLKALQKRAKHDEITTRFRQIAQLLTGDPAADAEQGLQWLQQLCDDLRVPSLSAYGIAAEHMPLIIEKTKAASSMKGNPVTLLDQELEIILRQSL
jgi:alcohol dehydrogenase class IV